MDFNSTIFRKDHKLFIKSILSQGDSYSLFSYANTSNIIAGRLIACVPSGFPIMQVLAKNQCHKPGKYIQILNLCHCIFLYQCCLCHNMFNLTCICIFTYIKNIKVFTLKKPTLNIIKIIKGSNL